MNALPINRRKWIFIFLIGISLIYFDFVVYQVLDTWSNRIKRSAFLLGTATSQQKSCHLPHLTPNDPLDLFLDEKQFASVGLNRAPDCAVQNSSKFYIDIDSNLIRSDPSDIFWRESKCFYRSHTRIADIPKRRKKRGLVTEITGDVTDLKEEMEIVSLWCYNNSLPYPKDRKILENLIYEDELFHIPISETTPPSISKSPPNLTSVLILLLDGVSQMGFIRHMPKSYNYLISNLTAIQFKGYNTFDHFSTQNILPLLTGLTFKQARAECHWETWKPVDLCPFLWQKFKSRGYVTSYIDENDRILFPFAEKPLDWDFRDVFYALNSNAPKIGHEHVTNKLGCFGSRFVFNEQLNLISKFIYRHHPNPFFHFTWSHTMTHNVNQYARYGDQIFVNFLNEMVTRGWLDNTIFLVMGDHGPRYGELRQESKQGFLEERLPLLLMILPENFRREYPQEVKNIEENSNKWVTALDIYATLSDLVDMSKVNGNFNEEFYSHSGTSLWRELGDRNCDDVLGQEPSYCICWDRKSLAGSDERVKEAGNFVLNELRGNLAEHLDCTKLEIKGDIMKATVRSENNLNGDNIYEFEFKTTPGSGQFFVSVQWVARKEEWRKLFMSRMSDGDNFIKCANPSLTQMS